jgi:hypothetical protein
MYAGAKGSSDWAAASGAVRAATAHQRASDLHRAGDPPLQQHLPRSVYAFEVSPPWEVAHSPLGQTGLCSSASSSSLYPHLPRLVVACHTHPASNEDVPTPQWRRGMWKHTFTHTWLLWIHLTLLKRAPTAQVSQTGLLTSSAYHTHHHNTRLTSKRRPFFSLTVTYRSK